MYEEDSSVEDIEYEDEDSSVEDIEYEDEDSSVEDIEYEDEDSSVEESTARPSTVTGLKVRASSILHFVSLFSSSTGRKNWKR